MVRLLDPLTWGHTGCCSHAATEAPQDQQQPQLRCLCQHQQQEREQEQRSLVAVVLCKQQQQ
jgi:hypothetical protein